MRDLSATHRYRAAIAHANLLPFKARTWLKHEYPFIRGIMLETVRNNTSSRPINL